MKTSNLNSKEAKIKLSLEDFNLDKIENLSSVVGGRGAAAWPTECTCTAGDSGCCDDCHVDDTGDMDHDCLD